MFDGTYPIQNERRANNTDRRPHKHDDERNPVIVPGCREVGFVWERDGPPIPTSEELNDDPNH